MSIIPRVTWFTEEDRKRVVAEAVEILEKIGVFIENDEAIELLSGAGARVDSDKGRVFIPAAMVEKAVESAPSRILVYNRHGEPVMDLGEDRIHFNPGSAALRIYDHKKKKARTPMTADLVRFSALTDALPNYVAQSTGIISGDVPEEIGDRYRVYIALQNSVKPVVTGTFMIDAFRVMHEMLATVAGDHGAQAENPMAIIDCCP